MRPEFNVYLAPARFVLFLQHRYSFFFPLALLKVLKFTIPLPTLVALSVSLTRSYDKKTLKHFNNLIFTLIFMKT